MDFSQFPVTCWWVSGEIVTVSSVAMSWQSQWQEVLAPSTTDAEHMAVDKCTRHMNLRRISFSTSSSQSPSIFHVCRQHLCNCIGEQWKDQIKIQTYWLKWSLYPGSHLRRVPWSSWRLNYRNVGGFPHRASTSARDTKRNRHWDAGIRGSSTGLCRCLIIFTYFTTISATKTCCPVCPDKTSALGQFLFWLGNLKKIVGTQVIGKVSP